MPRPKRHHFIPKWDLERFRDRKSDFLHVYDKIMGTYWTPKPKNIIAFKDYYQQKHAPGGIDSNILET